MITEHDMQAFGYYTEEREKAKQTPTDMVREFAKVTGQTTDAQLYTTLIHEEYGEWQKEVDPVAELKELADLLYVIYGYANARGWGIQEALFRVHKNNLERIIQPDGSIKRREDGKILKRANPPKVDLSDLV